MRTVLLVGLGLGLLLTPGCTPISYKPSLSLGESPTTVKCRVQIETFKDESPTADRGSKVAGTSATEPGTLAGDLAVEVTNAVLTDFSTNQVFESIQKRMDDPDLIMRGTIRRFYGHAGPNAIMWATIPVDIIWFFGVPIQSDEGAVDLEISFQRRDGSSVASYSGHSQFSAWYTIYTNPLLGIPTRLNKAFDQAVIQIRQQITADAEKLRHSARPQT